MIQIEENNAVEVHEYLNVLSKDSEFEKQCQDFAVNYRLPKQA